MDRPVERDDRDAAHGDQLVDHPDRAPGHLRGIELDPLAPGNTNYLLWMILGFLMVTAALVVSLGRLGDMYGRVRMYNLGFSVLTAFSILLAVTPLHRTGGALWLIAMRIDQRRGGDCRHAVGLIVGGVLAPLDWRLVFPVSG